MQFEVVTGDVEPVGRLVELIVCPARTQDVPEDPFECLGLARKSRGVQRNGKHAVVRGQTCSQVADAGPGVRRGLGGGDGHPRGKAQHGGDLLAL